MKSKELEAKTFVITFKGDVSARRLEDALYHGLERKRGNVAIIQYKRGGKR
ncbi:hypothetical protein MKX31_28215 [Bacillus sp. FSL M8-0063]|uniref:hypothetical protein n=1 Tax=Bacillus sp. FSL M8-0063 TaxID=2921566 RepID=UPI0030F666DA